MRTPPGFPPALAFLCLLAAPLPAAAGDAAATPARDVEVDVPVPESPAFTVLGLNPQAVERPASSRAFAMSLLNGVDPRGVLQVGLAVDARPGLLLAGRRLTLQDYRRSFWKRLLANAQLSLATAQAASPDRGIRAALGVRLPLWDEGDPRRNAELDACFDAAIGLLPSWNPLTAGPAAVEQASRAAAEAARRCREEKALRKWNAGALTVGAAPAWITPSGRAGDLRGDGGAVWSSVAVGVGRSGQLVGHLRYRADERVDPDEPAAGRLDSFLAGTIFRLGSPTLVASAEALYVNARLERGRRRERDASYRLGVGVERRLDRNLWLSVSVGAEGGRAGGEGRGFVLSSFKWATAREPSLPSIAPPSGGGR